MLFCCLIVKIRDRNRSLLKQTGQPNYMPINFKQIFLIGFLVLSNICSLCKPWGVLVGNFIFFLIKLELLWYHIV
ncbi:hypothetical protein H5410_014788 [Solanum commersonii]|uniref:Uncharacterized protein n=1 Tax=Solanum commersonii TaxID=4109 RepID=A0A9J5ZSG8_SOLCO|nr:hypothetical protein H5410_014788 [Solanum commersonii]